MSRIKYIKEIDKFQVLWEDGSKGTCSQRGADHLWPDRDWEAVKAKPDQWFGVF